jgi:hypothetical protein
VSGGILGQVEDLLAAPGAVLNIKPFLPLTVGLILTTLPQLKAVTIANTVVATQARIAAHGGVLLHHLEVPHDAGEIARGIQCLLGAGADMILISGVFSPANVWAHPRLRRWVLAVY